MATMTALGLAAGLWADLPDMVTDIGEIDSGILELAKGVLFCLMVAGLGGALMWLAWTVRERKHDRLEALAEEIRETEKEIGSSLARGDRLVPSGALYRLKGKLEELDIPTPRLLSPRVPLPRPAGQEWYDFLVRVGTAAELHDIKAAKNAWFKAELEWELTTRALAETIAEEDDAQRQADILEAMVKELRKGVENDPKNG